MAETQIKPEMSTAADALESSHSRSTPTTAMSHSPPSTRATRQSTRAVGLLRRLIASQWYEPRALATALVVSDATFAAYLSEAEPIPLDRQLCLALFVINEVPALARAGHQLRGQVAAAIAFEGRAIAGREQPRVTWF